MMAALYSRHSHRGYMPRHRRNEEETTETRPILLRRAGGHFYNDRGEDVSTSLPSSFPLDWEGEMFDYKGGWTRLREFFCDDYLRLGEMQEIIETRFRKTIEIS
jgi:hypothetical protein